jgi:hypothetical protein
MYSSHIMMGYLLFSLVLCWWLYTMQWGAALSSGSGDGEILKEMQVTYNSLGLG